MPGRAWSYQKANSVLPKLFKSSSNCLRKLVSGHTCDQPQHTSWEALGEFTEGATNLNANRSQEVETEECSLSRKARNRRAKGCPLWRRLLLLNFWQHLPYINTQMKWRICSPLRTFLFKKNNNVCTSELTKTRQNKNNSHTSASSWGVLHCFDLQIQNT